MGTCCPSNKRQKAVTPVVQVRGSSQSTDQQPQSKHTESAVDPVIPTLSKEQEAAMANFMQWSSLKTPPQILPKRVIPVCKFFGKRAQQTEITSLHFKWEGELIQFKAPAYPFDLLGVFEVDSDEGQAALNYGHIVLATLQYSAMGIKRLKDKKSVLRGVLWTAEAFFNSKIRCADAACTAALVEHTRISFLLDHEHYGAVIVRVREGALIAETVWGDRDPVASFDRTGNEKFIIICPKKFAVEFCKVGGSFLGNDSEIENEPHIIKRFEDIFQTSKTLVDTNGEVMVMKIDKSMKLQQANGE